MDDRGPGTLERWLRRGALAALGVALLVWPACWLLGTQAERLQLIAPFDEATVAVNRFQYEEEPTGRREDVVAIYGTPFGEAEEVLFVDEQAVVEAREAPGLRLLRKGAAQNPLKMQTVRFLTRVVSLGAGSAALAGGLLLMLLRARRRRRAVSG